MRCVCVQSESGQRSAVRPGAAQSTSRPLLDPAAYHSSVLRLASDDTQLWTHFDVMDNALAQITGSKRVVLWPPSEDENLYVDGSSSRVADVDAWNDEEYPLYRKAVHARRECELSPGDVLFIPALWFHNVTSIGFSVAVNVFWRSHPHERSADNHLYSSKDLYGNKDPPAATRALELAAASADGLKGLPEPFRSFYARRAARSLLELCSPPAPAATLGCVNHGATAASGSADSERCAQQRRAALSSCGSIGRTGSIPLVGFGCYELSRADTEHAVGAAIRAGIRHIDCASAYRNEAEVGRALHAALRHGEVGRAELFITSKLWNSEHSRVREACVRSLRSLQLDHLDLYLLHWPPREDDALIATWRQMEALVRDGLARAIGVSNCSAVRLRALLGAQPPLLVTPAVNQIEVHAGFRNDELRAFCAAHSIHVTAHSALGGGALLADPRVVDAAAQLGLPPSQLLLKWALDRGCSAVFRSRDAARIAQGADVGWQRPPTSEQEEMEQQAKMAGVLDGVAQERRVVGSGFVVAHKAESARSQHQYKSLEELWGS